MLSIAVVLEQISKLLPSPPVPHSTAPQPRYRAFRHQLWSYTNRVPSLFKNSIWNALSFIVVLAVGFVSLPLILHIVGARQYGLLVILSSIISPLSLATLNFGQATIKYVAEAHRRSDLKLAGNYVQTTLAFNLMVGLLIMCIVLALSNWLVTAVFNITPSDQELARQILYWVAGGWLINQLFSVFKGIPQGFQRYGLSSLGTIAYSVTVGVVSIGALYLTRNLLTYVQMGVIVQAVSLVGWVIVARRLMPGVSLIPRLHRHTLNNSFRFGFWQTLGQLGGLFATNVDTFLLGILLNTSAAGYFGVATTVQTQATTIGVQFAQVLFPRFSAQSLANDLKSEADLLMRATWLLTTLSAAIMIPVIVMGGDFLHLWVGDEVARESMHLLEILAFGGLLGSTTNVITFYLLGIGATKQTALIAVATGLTVLISSVVLIPHFGLTGAGWGNLLAMFVQAALVILIWWGRFRNTYPMAISLSALYGPVITGLALALTGLYVRTQLHYSITFINVAVGCILCSVVTLGIIVLVNRCLPGGQIHLRDVNRIMSWFRLEHQKTIN